jgi:hypothetical protein
LPQQQRKRPTGPRCGSLGRSKSAAGGCSAALGFSQNKPEVEPQNAPPTRPIAETAIGPHPFSAAPHGPATTEAACKQDAKVVPQETPVRPCQAEPDPRSLGGKTPSFMSSCRNTTRPLPFEVIVPLVLARMEQSLNFVRLGINTGQIWPFMVVAGKAAPREILCSRLAVVDQSPDVIDLETRHVKILRHLAILATIVGSLNDLPTKSARNGHGPTPIPVRLP